MEYVALRKTGHNDKLKGTRPGNMPPPVGMGRMSGKSPSMISPCSCLQCTQLCSGPLCEQDNRKRKHLCNMPLHHNCAVLSFACFFASAIKPVLVRDNNEVDV